MMARRLESLTLAQAQRLVLRAQGFGEPQKKVTSHQIARLFDRLHVIQMDSVNVLVRTHYLPIFSRLGAYDRQLLENAAYKSPRRLTEYWAHEASFIPVEMYPFFTWRMDDAINSAWGSVRRIPRERPELVADVLSRITNHGPLSASELETEEKTHKSGPWWDWRDTKKAVEWLFWSGQVAVSHRRHFERVYDIPARVLPSHVLTMPIPTPEEAWCELVNRAAHALGVATEADLRDYFRLNAAQTKVALNRLVEEGALQQVSIEGWRELAYAPIGVTVPRSAAPSALLSPFDSLVWSRPRTERLFGFRYRLEIYAPAPKRTYGYYVLPYLLDGDLVARVDLKADRQAKVLRVHGAFSEEGQERGYIAERLSADLALLAQWLEMETIEIGDKGDLAPLLRAV